MCECVCGGVCLCVCAWMIICPNVSNVYLVDYHHMLISVFFFFFQNCHYTRSVLPVAEGFNVCADKKRSGVIYLLSDTAL